MACTSDGGAITRKSMSDGICGACLLFATGTSGCGAGSCALRRALRRSRLLYSDCGGNTAGEPNGGRGLASRDLGSVRARLRDVANSLAYDSFEEGAEGALAAHTLGQEVEGALRAALVEVAPGFVAAARGEEVGVRRAILKAEGGGAVRGDLRCGCP